MTVKVRGTTISIGTTAATAATDTYTLIDGAKMLNGLLGPEFSEIDVTDLGDTYRQSAKGVADAGDLEIGGNYSKTDTGQGALETAAKDDNAADDDPYNFKIVQPDAGIVYVKARVMSFRVQYGTNANVIEFRAKLSLTDAYVEA